MRAFLAIVGRRGPTQQLQQRERGKPALFAFLALAGLLGFLPLFPAAALFAQFNPAPMPGQAQWQERAAQAALGVLDRTMLRQGNNWYVQFTINPPQQPPAPTGGFAPLVPLNHEPVAREGLMEIRLFPISAYALPGGNPRADWSGQVSVRIQQYRIYQPGVGWTAPKLVLLHFWEWDGEILGGQLALRSKTDRQYGTSDGGPTEFVASVFGVQPGSVTCSKPAPRNIPNLNPAPGPQPWRARYNQLAPLVPGQTPKP
jgi:hypothetical protein